MNYPQDIVKMTLRNEFMHVALPVLMSTLIGAMFPTLKVAEQSIRPLSLSMLRVLMESGACYPWSLTGRKYK